MAPRKSTIVAVLTRAVDDLKADRKQRAIKVLENLLQRMAPGDEGKPSPVRKLSEYNVFMKSAIPRIREEHRELNHQQRLALAAQQWAEEKHKRGPRSSSKSVRSSTKSGAKSP